MGVQPPIDYHVRVVRHWLLQYIYILYDISTIEWLPRFSV